MDIHLPDPATIKQRIKDKNNKAIFEPDEYDEALVGYTCRGPGDPIVAVYDAALCRELASRMGMSTISIKGMFAVKPYNKVSAYDPIYMEYS